jgi:hypothetical protein
MSPVDSNSDTESDPTDARPAFDQRDVLAPLTCRVGAAVIPLDARDFAGWSPARLILAEAEKRPELV